MMTTNDATSGGPKASCSTRPLSPRSPETLLPWVADRFLLEPPLNISLLRSYTNDVFLLSTPRASFVLKIYGQGWRTLTEIRYEVGLLTHLTAKGIPVASAVIGKNHQAVQLLPTPTSSRLAVLFDYASGAKPQPPFAPALYEQEGRAAAALHRAADDFVTTYQRRPLNTVYLLDEPLALILSLCTDPNARRFFQRFAEQLRGAIQTLSAQGLDWGPVHGDLTLDNLHVTPDGQIVWYDFDSGGPGWRAGDLQGWAAFQPDAAPKWNAFLRGYQSVRPLDPINIEATPYIFVAFEIWGMAVDLRRRFMRQGNEAIQLYLAASLAKLAPRVVHFGFDQQQ